MQVSASLAAVAFFEPQAVRDTHFLGAMSKTRRANLMLPQHVAITDLMVNEHTTCRNKPFNLRGGRHMWPPKATDTCAATVQASQGSG